MRRWTLEQQIEQKLHRVHKNSAKLFLSELVKFLPIVKIFGIKMEKVLYSSMALAMFV